MAKYLDATGITTIWNKCKSSFLSKGGGAISGDLTVNGKAIINTVITAYSPDYPQLIRDWGLRSDYTSAGHPTGEFLQAWSKWAQSVAPGRAIQSCIGPNSIGYIFAHAYSSGYSSDTGLPMHLTGCYFAHSGYPVLFGTSYGNWYEKSIITSGDIGQQSVSYANSAGSVAWGNITGKPSTFTPSDHSHSYLPLSGGTLSGVVYGNTGSGLNFQSSNTGNWKEGIRVYPASNNFSLISLQDSSSNNVFAMVTNVAQHLYYFDVCVDGTNHQIVMPQKGGTIALTSDIPTNNNQLTNGAGYITSSGSCNYANSAGSVSGYSMLSNWQGDVNSFQNTGGLLAGKLYGCSNAPLSYYSFLHSGYGSYYMQFNARSNVLYFRSSGEDGYTPSWVEVITSKNIGSQNVNSSTYASSYLANRQSIGSSSQDHAQALQSYFDSYKSSIPRECLTANYSSSYGNGSLYFGYFLSGYDSTPYGGFYVCHYNTPYYVGISHGSYSQQQIITSSSIGSQSVNYANSAGSVAWGNISGKPSTFTPSSHTHDYLSLSGGTLTGSLAITASTSYESPALKLNYYSDYSVTDASIAQLKFGPTSMDSYLGVAPSSNTIFGKNAYFFHVGAAYEFDWMTSGWGKLMALEASTGNLWIKGTLNGGTPITSSNISSQSVNYANSAGSAGSTTYIGPQSYTPTSDTVAGHKEGLVNWMNKDSSVGIGKHVIVGASIINQWDNDSATYYDSSVYAMIKIGGGYNYSTYGQWLLSSYYTTRLGVVGRNSSAWSSIKWLAWTSDIPTNTNQLTNGAGYITSSGSCSYSNNSGDSSKLSGLPINRFIYSVGSGNYGTSERTGNSEDFERTMFWRDNNKGAIGVFVAHSSSTSYGWEIHTGYGKNSDFVGRVKENGTWGSERTFITSANISSYAATSSLSNSEIDNIIT